MNTGIGGALGVQQLGAMPGPRVAVRAADELERRRVVNALEDDGLDVVQATGVDGAPHATVAADVAVLVTDDLDDVARGTGSPDGKDKGRAVVVSRRSDRSFVSDAIVAGVLGVVPEAQLEERLAPTVRAVAAGQLTVPADHRDAVSHPILSPREKQVMSMVVLGFTNLEIATKLHVTETTVKSHLSSAYRKLGVRSRHEATALILSTKSLGHGILTLAGGRGAN